MFKKYCIPINDGTLVGWQGGSGPNLVAIPGGPGLSSDYLRDFLGDLSEFFCVTYFDLPGCGVSEIRTVNLDSTLRALHEVIQASVKESENFTVFAHSWGVSLLAIYLTKAYAIAPNISFLINPAPLDWVAIQHVTGKLLARVCPETMKEISGLHAEGTRVAGAKIMELGLPAYCGREENLPQIILDYDISTADILTSELKEFDAWGSLRKMGRIFAAFGTTDYICTQDYSNVLEQFESVEIIDGGHFLMLDSPRILASKINAFASKARTQ